MTTSWGEAWADAWGAPTPTCPDGVCGTGLDVNAPKPGDPSTNATIQATGEYGGIAVSWTYPTTLPHAVMHTKLYRGITANVAQAVEQVIVSGNYFFDRIASGDSQTYYYWIRIVTVNGTVQEPIGPASAVALRSITQIMEELTGLIDEGYLAKSLKERINLLDVLNRDLGAEIADRLAGSAALHDALAAVQSETGEAVTYINREITERTSTTEALAESIDIMAAGLASNAAAIVEEKAVRVTEAEAAALVINTLYTKFGENAAAISNEQLARTAATEALAKDINTVVVENDTLGAAIVNEAKARVTADTALSTQIATAQTAMNGNIASAQTVLESKINVVDGKVVSIGALYTAKVDVNGLIGGFGVYNDGRTVEAGFDVDRFWIGRTTNKIKPFIIDGGVVYIDKARIRSADIDTLKIAGDAVIVPGYTAQAGTANGNGGDSFICAIVVSNAGNNTPMKVVIMASGLCGYSAGMKSTSWKIMQSGVGQITPSFSVTAAFVTTPSITGYATIPAGGSSAFTFYWSGADSTVFLNSGNMVVLGVKR